MSTLKESILQEFVGQSILEVTYFEINHPDDRLYFEGFDCFDLGIELRMSNGSWHIGWKSEDHPEIGLGSYDYRLYHEDSKKVDSTHRWSNNFNSPISNIDLTYVSFYWKIPAKCTITFENQTSVSIILGEELNLNETLPIPLKYTESSEFYVFHGIKLPAFELVRIETSEEYIRYRREQEAELETEITDIEKTSKRHIVGSQTIIFIAFLILIIYLTISYLFFEN